MTLTFKTLLQASLLMIIGLQTTLLQAQLQPLWLNYAVPLSNETKNDFATIRSLKLSNDSPTKAVIVEEVENAWSQFFNVAINLNGNASAQLIIEPINDQIIKNYSLKKEWLNNLNDEGFIITNKKGNILITAKTDIGLLYGTYKLLSLIQSGSTIAALHICESPKLNNRILNHWDNLDRTSERGYAGFSIWDWHRLPGYLDPRYKQYARLNAAIGINGSVLTNVNSNALVMTPPYLEKVKSLADVFRPYGIKVYLTARFSAPIEIGGLSTADPLAPEVQQWWQQKTDEIYALIPDFGGYLVKANSEGQPGPQNYGRSHADGANMMARALAPHGGIVMWRAFVYSHEEPEDRAKQAYNEFVPLDGSFDPNVMVQVKNGAIDFQPREPFHPIFGAMPKTPLMMEFQITQEYLGQATQLVFLAPMYEEVLKADTYAKGQGSTVAKVIEGKLDQHTLTGMAGVANTGTADNWTGHPIAQSNWYAFGRMAWNPEAKSEPIATDWIIQTYGQDETIYDNLLPILMHSHEAAVNYMTPLGLHHMMGTGHHYGPAPWVNDLPRADWNPVYYHKADANGIGFDRSKTGSNATSQYFPEVAKTYDDLATCPEKYLLWFHHCDWDYALPNGNTLWQEIGNKYQSGIDTVRAMQQHWEALKSSVSKTHYEEVAQLLKVQEQEAIWWKDACLLYFQSINKKDWPIGVEPAEESLEYYQGLQFPFAPGN